MAQSWASWATSRTSAHIIRTWSRVSGTLKEGTCFSFHFPRGTGGGPSVPHANCAHRNTACAIRRLRRMANWPFSKDCAQWKALCVVHRQRVGRETGVGYFVQPLPALGAAPRDKPAARDASWRAPHRRGARRRRGATAVPVARIGARCPGPGTGSVRGRPTGATVGARCLELGEG